MLKAGIIGLGQIGYKIDEDLNRDLIWSHAKAYMRHPKIDLHAVSDNNKNQYNDFKLHYPDVSFFQNYLDMVGKKKFDLISICTPTHLDLIKNIISSNPPKAFFIEKPMGSNLDEAIEISNMCKDKKIILAVNYMRRWDNAYIFVYEMIQKQKLGNLQNITAYGNTALLTSTSHLIDLMIYFGGHIEWLVGDLQKGYVREAFGDLDPGGISFIKFKKGHHGFLKGTSKNDDNVMFEIDLLFSDGRIKIMEPWITNDESDIQVQLFLPIDATEEKSYHILKNYSVEESYKKNERMIDAMSDIVNCISNKENPLSGGTNSIMVHKIINSIKLSSNNDNMRVCFDE